ncbi:MAG: TldD/PmbA family protein [Candidatus Bathyarchaeia archaeon]|jgi:TldD protein
MEDLVQHAIEAASAKGVQYAEARLHTDSGSGVTLTNGKPEPVQLAKAKGIAVRVLVDGALGFASTNDLSKESLDETVDIAYRTAKASKRLVTKPIRLSKEKAEHANWETKARKPLLDVTIEEKLAVLEEIEKNLSPSVVKVDLPSRTLVLIDDITDRYFADTEGSKIHGVASRIGLLFVFTASEPGKGIIQRIGQKGETGGWERLEAWDLPKCVPEEARILGKILREAKQAPRGELDLVLGSEVTGIACHESCGHPQEADRILGREAAQAGESYLKPDMIGHRIGTEAVTVVDDPTVPNSYGFYEYDEEGVRAGRRTLIKNGVIAGFLQNRETAAELGVSSNGAARAVSYDREPIIRMANTFMLPGEYNDDELVEDLSKGVFIKTFMEWNIDDRRYNQRYVGLEAYLIENGQITNAVRNPILEITTPGFYGSVDAVGKKVEYEAATCGKGEPEQAAPVWHGGPPIRLRKVRLGG